MVGRIVRSADFERVLRQPPCARSAHFAIHQLPSRPTMPDLSTASVSAGPSAVDEPLLHGLWLGSVVPKRHARRAATRNLIKRQIRAALSRRAGQLAAGYWVVRLKAPIEVGRWPSAASRALARALHDELDDLLRRAPSP